MRLKEIIQVPDSVLKYPLCVQYNHALVHLQVLQAAFHILHTRTVYS